MRHIVMISQIPLWSMNKAVGGPSFAQTISHLAENHRISLVQPHTGYFDADDLPKNVTLYPFEHHLHGAFRQVRKIGWVTDTAAWYTFRWSAWPIVKQLCEAGDVDLVYGYDIYGVPVARKAADAFGLPMVGRYQGTLMVERQRMPLSTLRFWKHVVGLSTPADLIIMTNDGSLGRDYLLSIGQPEDRIRFWINGVDRTILSDPRRDVRPELGIPADVPMLLTVSRLASRKRLDRAIRLVAELAARGSRARLVIAGQGDQESKLRELAMALGVSDRVTFAGGVPRTDLASYYTSADLLVSLEDHTNLVNNVIEGMLLGRLIVTLDIGGTRDLVIDGVNAVLVESADDTKILADTVESLLDDPELRARLGRSAGEWARANLWTWDERMAAEITEIDRLIDTWRGGKASLGATRS